MSDVLQVAMLREVSIQWNGQTLDDSSSRIRRVWLFLAYLIYARNSHTTQENDLALLRGTGGHETEDPTEHQPVVRRKYPHSPANIHYSVQPLEPMAHGMLPHLDQ